MRPPKVVGGRTESVTIKLSKDEKLLLKTIAGKMNASQADMLMCAIKDLALKHGLKLEKKQLEIFE
ncbi:MAG: putative transcriptional regulator [Flammeovirgaceae bacterium]|jgi:predicted transcriptional regulator